MADAMGKSGIGDKFSAMGDNIQAKIKDLEAKAKNATGDTKIKIQNELNDLKNRTHNR